jgi:hypothetical protein
VQIAADTYNATPGELLSFELIAPDEVILRDPTDRY